MNCVKESIALFKEISGYDATISQIESKDHPILMCLKISPYYIHNLLTDPLVIVNLWHAYGMSTLELFLLTKNKPHLKHKIN